MQEGAESPIRGISRNTIWLAGLIWKDKKLWLISLVVMFVCYAAFPFLLSGVSGLLVNETVKIAGTGEASAYFWTLLLSVTGLMLLNSWAFSFRNYFQTVIFDLFLDEKFEFMLLKKRSEIDAAVYENPKYNDLFIKVTENAWSVKYFVNKQFWILDGLLQTAIAASVIIFFKWWILLIILLTTLPELMVGANYGKRFWEMHDGRAERRRRYYKLDWHFRYPPYLLELKVFQGISYFFSEMKTLYKGFVKEQRELERRRIKGEFIASLFSLGAIIFATGYFYVEVVDGAILIGTMYFVTQSIASFRQSLSGLFLNLASQYKDSLFVSDIHKFNDIAPIVVKPSPGFKLDPEKTPEIVFENVTFAYPGTDTPVLKNFSLTVEPGAKLAVVGANGAGKSTFVKLLCRFYDPQLGRIKLNGYDLREIELESLYALFGMLPQEYARYHFPVKEAIAFGRPSRELSMQKVAAAAEASEADEFILKWENQYEQMLGREFTGGLEPSVGEWQRLGLARIFYRDARVTILDEPTASIDAEAEVKIFEKLELLPSDRTVILISHRFSTVRRADKICVISGGEIKELGSHEELIASGGIYAKLFAIQAKGYK